ncbi:TlpA family protein disulfide reductase [Planomicrobium okeanokoites]|uniref:TlpA family protein disulfide reductase n=1 Tax=Planomicrobium okeanokoites TaxID=244 RepID=A0ABV7KKR0_PLAOK|nr:redoxin domain-containing protein [Planomicrobium okeanokoites]TAA69549.1 redoxin domain-containing protein [Planomicrobium okeanokoites]
MKKLLATPVFIIIIMMLAACSDGQTSSSAEQLNEGKPAPDFKLVDLKGETHELSEYAGQKVYIKFWASWCSICLSGMNELNELAGEEPDFEVLTIVSPDSNAEKSSDSFAKWYKGLDNTSNIQVLLDEEGPVFDDYGVIGYPTSVYIGSDGVMFKSQTGHVSNEQIYETFESIQ